MEGEAQPKMALGKQQDGWLDGHKQNWLLLKMKNTFKYRGKNRTWTKLSNQSLTKSDLFLDYAKLGMIDAEKC